MPFKKGNPQGHSGRPKGAKNHDTDAQKDLLNAWDRASGPETALKIMKAAIDLAVNGQEVVKRDDDGNEVSRYFIKDFKPLVGILPYIATKKTQKIESDGLDDLVGIIKQARERQSPND